MERKKYYSRVMFEPSAIEAFIEEIKCISKDSSEVDIHSLAVEKLHEDWTYDNIEEFYSEIRTRYLSSAIRVSSPDIKMSLYIWNPEYYDRPSIVSIESNSRENILRLSNIVDNFATSCFVPKPETPKKETKKPKIFIGHGGSMQWRDLKDHLQDKHGFNVLAYETGSRAGHTIRDIIAEMLENSSFAILVMTGEDVMEDGTVMARQNVIHEIGLFQGRLGFTKAVVLKEEGTREFTNISGVNQIRYSKSNIKETFGEILGVLRREFGSSIR